jgi:hypothetical protein
MKNQLIQISKKIDTNAYYQDGRVNLSAILELNNLISKVGGDVVFRETSACGVEVSDLFVQIVESLKQKR